MEPGCDSTFAPTRLWRARPGCAHRPGKSLPSPEIGADGSFDSLALSDDESDALDALDARLPDDSDVIAVFRHYFSTHPENFERA